MEISNPFYMMPNQNSPIYIGLALASFLVFAGTIGLELYRRGARARQQLAEEWIEAGQLMVEKDLAADQRQAVEKLLRRRTPKSPYRTLTRRAAFDECVAAEVEGQRRKLDFAQMEELGAFWRSIRAALGLEFVPLGQTIASTRDLYLDQRMWVAPASGAEPGKWHSATVTAVNEAHFLIVVEDAPQNRVRDGATVHCRLWRDDDGRYAFDVVLARAENRPAGWVMQHTDRLQRTQSRAHYRVTHEQAADIALVEAPRDGNYEGMHQREKVAKVNGRVVSLSGGGFAVTVSQPLPAQVLLRLRIEMDAAAGDVVVVGKIVGSQALYAGRYLVRCSFVEISDEERDVVTQYVFRRQTHLTSREGLG